MTFYFFSVIRQAGLLANTTDEIKFLQDEEPTKDPIQPESVENFSAPSQPTPGRLFLSHPPDLNDPDLHHFSLMNFSSHSNNQNFLLAGNARSQLYSIANLLQNNPEYQLNMSICPQPFLIEFLRKIGENCSDSDESLKEFLEKFLENDENVEKLRESLSASTWTVSGENSKQAVQIASRNPNFLNLMFNTFKENDLVRNNTDFCILCGMTLLSFLQKIFS